MKFGRMQEKVREKEKDVFFELITVLMLNRSQPVG